jgi:hypothetical protein
MRNRYLHIGNGSVNYTDNVFSGIARITEERSAADFCLEKAEDWRHSTVKNYDTFSAEQREEIARRWEAAKDLPDGEYEYYFNLEDKSKVFKLSVAELAKSLGIKYELKLKGGQDE